MTLTRSLKMLSTVRPDEWPIENTDNLISQGQQVIDRCEEEFAGALLDGVRELLLAAIIESLLSAFREKTLCRLPFGKGKATRLVHHSKRIFQCPV